MEIDNPERGRKSLAAIVLKIVISMDLEIDNPERGRKYGDDDTKKRSI